jgi:3-phenylpropionate/trans-cinnamate dioxygenase ferredoxin reductase subunit
VRSYRYLVVGGGMTADAACKGIRAHDEKGTIALVGEEPYPPYARPPLTKALWKDSDESKIWRGTEELDLDLRLGRRIVSLDLEKRHGTDDAGDVYEYERLLLATGGSARRLPFGGDEIVYFRTLDDYRWLRARAGEGVRFFVIGGGFIGSEIAAALAMNGCSVTIAFPEAGIGARVFPAELSAYVTEYYRSKGVDVRSGDTVGGIESNGGVTRVETESGTVVETDVVVAGLGIEPATSLASAAGLDVRDGIVVDEYGRASGREDVFAAGDVARFPVPALGTEARVEHEDHAKSHGKSVGGNMAGAREPYDHLPFFYSDLFELGYEAVGEVDPRHATIAEWIEPNRKGVVCYLDDARRPRGFLLWDVWGKVEEASRLIRAAAPVDEAQLRELIG